MRSERAGRGGRAAAAVAIATLLVAIDIATLDGQAVLRGIVLDDETAQPLEHARVEFIDHLQRRYRQVVTDHMGQFIFPNAPIGSFRLRAARIGYRPVTTPRWWLERGDTLSTEVRLHPAVMLLAPLEIVARARTSPILEDYDHRKERGFGTYLTRQDVENRAALSITDLLATVPGVHVVTGSASRGASGRNISMSRALPGCVAQIYMDGLLMTRPGDTGFILDDIVRPEEIEGIEIYRGLASVPAAFATREARCGVVAIWTRRGIRDR